MRTLVLLLALWSSVALADHIPNGVGLDYKGTWAVLIVIGVMYACLILGLLWAWLDGQFKNVEKIKYSLLEPDEDYPRGTSLERPE